MASQKETVDLDKIFFFSFINLFSFKSNLVRCRWPNTSKLLTRVKRRRGTVEKTGNPFNEIVVNTSRERRPIQT